MAPTAPHITDKLWYNFHLIGLIHLALPNSRIIHVIRDPIDTCVSCFSKLLEIGYANDLAELGRYYKRYERPIGALAAGIAAGPDSGRPL